MIHAGRSQGPRSTYFRSAVDERVGDIRRWAVADLKAPEVFKLLEMDHDGLLLCKAGKKKVNDECLHCSLAICPRSHCLTPVRDVGMWTWGTTAGRDKTLTKSTT